MLHLFVGNRVQEWNHIFLVNEMLWIEVFYAGEQQHWRYILYPYWDDNRKTISYYAFDSIDQRDMFEKVLKISGIGAKTAFHIVQFPLEDIRRAIQDLDMTFFQNLPGVGPKIAKKLLLELKDTVKTEDFVKLAVDEKLYKNIVSTLKNLWYETAVVKSVLQTYDGHISKDTMWEVIKWVIGKI